MSEEIRFYYIDRRNMFGPPDVNPTITDSPIVRIDTTKRDVRRLVWMFNTMHEAKRQALWKIGDDLPEIHNWMRFELGDFSMNECMACYLSAGRFLGDRKKPVAEIMNDVKWLIHAAGMVYKLHNADTWRFHLYLWNELIKECPVCKMVNLIV